MLLDFAAVERRSVAGSLGSVQPGDGKVGSHREVLSLGIAPYVAADDTFS